ncbi:MAG: hypothetical protein LC687_01415 [Actinobacteria bacterium]|nr:hypothetical protein [Actinomycetota bacterium]
MIKYFTAAHNEAADTVINRIIYELGVSKIYALTAYPPIEYGNGKSVVRLHNPDDLGMVVKLEGGINVLDKVYYTLLRRASGIS